MNKLRRQLLKIAGAYGQITDPQSSAGIRPDSEYPGPGEYEPLVRTDTSRKGAYPTSKYSVRDEETPQRFAPKNNLTAGLFSDPKKVTDEQLMRYKDLARK
jgi:hypothetical protein